MLRNLALLIDSVKIFNGLKKGQALKHNHNVQKVHSEDISSIQSISIDSSFYQHLHTTMPKSHPYRS